MQLKLEQLLPFVILSAFIALCYIIFDVIRPFLLSLVMAYILNPLALSLYRLTKLNYNLISIIVTSIAFALIITCITMVIPILYEQVTILIGHFNSSGDNIITRYSHLLSWLNDCSPDIAESIKHNLSDISAQLLTLLGEVLRRTIRSSFAAIDIISIILITPVATFYLLRDWKLLMLSLLKVIPIRWRDILFVLLKEIDIVLIGFIKGQFSVCGILAIYYALGLMMIGLNSGIVVGIIFGILALIPYIGAFIGTFVSLLIGLLQFGVGYKLLLILLILAVGHVLESTIITPKFVGDSIKLHPLWVIFSLLLGGSLFGIIGVLCAAPIAGASGVIIRAAIRKYKNSIFFVR